MTNFQLKTNAFSETNREGVCIHYSISPYFFLYPVIMVIKKQTTVAHAQNLCCFISSSFPFHYFSQQISHTFHSDDKCCCIVKKS